MARRAQLRQRHALLLSDKGGQRDATGILAGQKIHRGSLGPGMDTRARRANRANSVNSDERANIKTSYKSPLAGIKETCCYYNPRAGPGVGCGAVLALVRRRATEPGEPATDDVGAPCPDAARDCAHCVCERRI